MKAVIFDAEGTIVHIRPSVGRIYADVLKNFGKEVEAEEVEQRFRRLWPEIKSRLKEFSEKTCYEFWRDAFFSTVYPWLEGIPGSKAFELAYELFGSSKAFTKAPGIEEALVYLRRRGIKTAVLSNWDHRLHAVLKELGLYPYFDCVLAACEIGIGKPQKEAFLLTCDLLRVRPSEALMIGNDPEDDYRGAIAAGLSAYLYENEDFETLLKDLLEGSR